MLRRQECKKGNKSAPVEFKIPYHIEVQVSINVAFRHEWQVKLFYGLK